MDLSELSSEASNNIPSDNLILRELQLGDKVTGFSLGNRNHKDLKFFLQREALRFHKCNVAKTYVIVNSEKIPNVLAYISLMCSVIKTAEMGEEDHPDDLVSYSYVDFPAVKLARLAVHKDIRSHGLGKMLVNFAISVARDSIMPNIGCRFLVVDAKQDAVVYYENKCAFTLLDTDQNKEADQPMMYIDLQAL